MRPVHVELEGIGSFRDRAELDLDGVDLFVLSGPTGAGKTTLLVDAMMLALYGTIPRYEDRRMVAPIVHQGANEGRVRLRFAVGDRTYTATRVVRRTKTGATTKEARLEDVTGGGSTLLAGTADEVTAAVEALIGLTFEQFCRSVVLPQGAFDRFLFAKPSERADLLVQLLDLGLHEQVGKRARALATEAGSRADAAQRRLDGDLAGADPAELDAAQQRVDKLTDLAATCRAAQDELDALTEQGGELRAAAEAAVADRDALAALARPDDVDALADATRAAVAAHEDATQARAEADAALEAAEAARAELPDAEVIGELIRAARTLAEAEAAIPAAAAQVDASTREVERTTAAVTAAAEVATAARADLDAARRRELVHAVSAGLHAGDDCPVCGGTLAQDPQPDGGAQTDAAEVALRDAEAAHQQSLAAQQAASNAAAAAAERHRSAVERRDGAAADLATARDRAGTPDDDAVASLQQRVATADAALVEARGADAAARRTERGSAAAVEAARAREATAWTALERARDAVARLGPPTTDRSDLAAAWDQLLAWGTDAAPTVAATADEAVAAVAALRDRYREADRDLREACGAAGVDVATGTRPSIAVAEALATARARHQAVADRIEQAATVAAERDAAREEAQVAEVLGKLLRAEGFERWLLNRALGRLVDGAATLLRELTSGTYSLALDATNQFLVIDHRNADEPRTVKSLSGGERFLASLALALALADHVAELAADGAARLESLFLDEGFGTLDPDTLDVVAAALEELGSRGRVVGIVTHVRDLADRLPVRFEVRRGPTGSSVTRHDHAAGPEEDVA